MNVRQSARVILMNPEGKVLLFQAEEFVADDCFREPGSPARDRTFWITPGGGAEEGESLEETASREVFEETGYRVTALGPAVLDREKRLENRTTAMLFRDRFFFVRLTDVNHVSTGGHTEFERRFLRGHRWWSLDELERTTETIYPEGFASLVRGSLESLCV